MKVASALIYGASQFLYLSPGSGANSQSDLGTPNMVLYLQEELSKAFKKAGTYDCDLWMGTFTDQQFLFLRIKKEPLMCFRPGGVAKAFACPNCGKKLIPLGGVIQKKCPFCKIDFTPYIEAAKQAEAARRAAGTKPAEDEKPE